MMYYGGGGMGWAGWLMMGLSFLVFWGLIAAAVVWFVRSLRGPASRPDAPTGRGADEMLAERFARGEIDAEEFTARRAVLYAAPNNK
jgi:putative membrane protein